MRKEEVEMPKDSLEKILENTEKIESIRLEKLELILDESKQ